MPTIEDVARRAGVSRSTVSLVINKSPLVKEATRQKVERVIEEINYVPNSNARGLSARVTNNLGVVIMQDYLPDSTEISYDNDQHIGLCSFNIFNGIMAGLLGTDYGVITERFCSVGDPEALPRMVLEKRVDGLFVVSTPYSDCFIENLKKTGLPFVIVGVSSFEEGIDSIYANPYDGTKMAVEELIRTGHKKICMLNCSAWLSGHKLRLDGYRDALNEYGIEFDPKWNLSAEKNNGRNAKKAFKAFWEAGNRPDAIVAANAQSATGAMVYLYEQGVKIPDDISIIAYEDSSLCGYCSPALTAINIRKEEMGSIAARCLIEKIRNREKEVEHFAVEPYLVRRDSVSER
ncbi:MAG: LacI family transcriptional regulator [Clostridiales bacterium]|nr:LacI family transcriptional regulator [Clostridiales bacterium]